MKKKNVAWGFQLDDSQQFGFPGSRAPSLSSWGVRRGTASNLSVKNRLSTRTTVSWLRSTFWAIEPEVWPRDESKSIW